MKYDEIVSHLGDFGPYQRRIYFILSLLCLLGSWHLLVQLFLAGGADHWCVVDEWKDVECLAEWNLTYPECEEAKKDASIPAIYDPDLDIVTYSQCLKYNVTGLEFEPDVKPLDNNTYSCDEGWIYDRSQYKSTIIMDFDLVCGRKQFPEIAQAINFVGNMIGSFILGILADRIGRYYALYIAIVSTATTGFITAFSNSYWMYTIMRLFVGATNYGIVTVAFVTATELVGPSKRVIAGVAIQMFFAVGFMTLAGLGALIRKWRYLQLTISLIPLLYLFFIPILPESPRWLLSQNKKKKAMTILKKMAKVNGRTLPKLDTDDAQREAEYSALDILRSPVLTFRLLTLMFVWFVHTMVYYGLSLSSADFGVSVYLAFLLSGFVELPAYVMTAISMEVLGRRYATFILMMLGGITCILTPFVPLGAFRTTMAMIGKFGISASFGLVYIWAVEIFPTPLRANGVGLCTFASQSGGIVSPLLLLLGDAWAPFPFVIFGSLTIAAGGMALLLPETKNQLMPETIADAEALGTKGIRIPSVADDEL